MKKFFRWDTLITVGLFAIKIGTSVKTGMDTYQVSNDLFSVVLLDGIFLCLWLVLAYGGKSAKALTIRPFAALFAYILYFIMLAIGWSAHTDAPLVAVGVRMGGLMMLVYDTSGYVVTAIQAGASGDASKSWMVKLYGWRLAMQELRKQRLVEHVIIMAEQESRQEIGLLGDDLRKDLNKERLQWFNETYRPLLDDKFEEMVVAAMEDTPIDISITRPYMGLPAPKLVSSAQKTTTTNAQWSNSGRTVKEVVDVTVAKWEEIYPLIPFSFNRKKIEELCDCKSTWAVKMINYGKSQGQVVEVARGKYQKIIEGEIAEDLTPEEQPILTYDESYAMFTETDGMWLWECGLCKDTSGVLYDTREDAQDAYSSHAADKKHLSGDQAVKTAFTPSEPDVTFSK